MSVKWSYRTLCLSYLLSFFAICISAQSLLSQATIPTLSLPDYESLQMADVYGQAYFSQSLASWSAQVEHYKGILRANWEAAADNAIFTYVDSITISDSFNDVDAYKDYVARELGSQKLEAMGTWEDQANLDFLENYNEFVSRLQTGRLNESYLSRLISQSELNSQNAHAQDQNVLLNSINNARSQWEQMMSEQYYQGQYEFMTAQNEIEGKYQDVLSQLDAQEAIFNDNLQEINKYKKVVEGAISSMLTDFEGQLAEACTRSQDCAYRTANNGGLNNAGLKLQKFINDIRAKLNAPVTTTEFYLTDLSDALNTFLKGEYNQATDKYNDHLRRSYTYQNTLSGASLSYSAVDSNINTLVQGLNNGNYDEWSASFGYAIWRPNRNYSVVANFNADLLNKIWDNDQNGIRSILNSILGSGRVVEGQIYHNIFARNKDFINKAEANDHLAWTGVGHHTFQCHWPYWGCDPNNAFFGNRHKEQDAFATYDIYRGGGFQRYQMDHISFGLVYTVKDNTQIAYKEYWDSMRTSMNRQISDYEMKIIPAIANWETQASNYSKAYAEWKVQANIAKAQAKVDYDAAMADLKANESRWMAKAREEYASGLASWEEMSQNVLESETREQFELANKSISTQANTLFESNWQTGASQTVSSYSQTIASLTEREFTVTTALQNPLNQIAEISQIKPGKAGLEPDAMDLGYTVRLDLGQSLSPNIGLTSVSKVPVASQTYSLFQANSQLKVETSVTAVDVASTFQKTSNGIYQFSQLLSMNENNDRSALFEQRRMINQNTYNINWGARSVASFDDSGNLVGDARFKDILTILTDSKKSKPLIDSCMSDTKKSYQDCFNTVHSKTLHSLKEIDPGLSYEDGMIVRSLSAHEKDLLGMSEIKKGGQTDPRFGICYVNPNDSQCVGLLRKDFDVTFNESTRVATFTKIISNGKIGGRNAKGEYISGTQSESRTMMLSSVDPVMAPKGKDLFDIWSNDDWKDVEDQNMAVNQRFYSTKLASDGRIVQSSVASILKVESENDAKFRKAKQDQEAQDSLIKDLIIAYISGGTAGVKGAIKSKVEDKINASLAEAWARASGADEDQIALLTQAVSFLRGKVAEKNIKKDMAKNNLRNAGMAVVAGGLSYATGGMSNLLMANGPMAAMNAFGGGVSKMFGAASGLLSNPMVVGATAAFGQAAAGFTMGVTNAAYRGIAGDKKADAFTNKMTGPKDRLAAIKANEQSIIQSHVTQAVAKSTGLPMEVVGNIITDYKGAQAAKKVRNAVNGNPFANIGTQVVGAVGGIIKTAIVATGMPERDIQKSFSDGNRMLFAGSRDSTLEAQTLAYTNQAFGMKAPGTSYTSSTPTLKDKKGFVKELFQREAVNQLSVGMSEDERAVLNSALRGTISRVEQSKADKKARAEAVRSTVVTAVTTAVTLGAASGLSVFSSIGQTVSNGINAVARFLGSGFTMAATAAPHVGAAVINAGIQMADGARNGVDGMTAGFLNGAIGVFTAGGAFDFGEVTDAVTKVTSKSTLGLGVSYDRQNGWGGMLGVGGASANASISFSQRGNTTINGSWNTGFRGVQVTASSTTNGEQTIGANFNPSNEGPRRGWNIGANYDFNGGGASANVGYTDAATGLGLTSTIDRNGLSTSSSLNGNNYGTMTQDGYTAEEFNWAQNNINMAQNRTDDLARDANSIAVLKKSGMSDADINAMSPEDRDRAANKILREKENKQLQDSGKTPEEIARMTEYEREQALDRLEGVATIDNFTADDIARAALGLVGAFTGIAGLAFAGGTTGNNVPNRSHAVTPEVLARNEEEGDSEVAVDRDGKPLPPKPMKMPERVADIVPPKPAEQTKLPSAPEPMAHPKPTNDENPQKTPEPMPEPGPKPQVRTYTEITTGLLQGMSPELRASVISKFEKSLSGESIKVLMQSEERSREKIVMEKLKITSDRKEVDRWSKDGAETKQKEIIARGVAERLQTESYTKALEKQKQIDGERARLIDIGKGKNLLEINALKDKGIDFQTDQIVIATEAYARAVKAGEMTEKTAEFLLKEKSESLQRQRELAMKEISSATYLKTIQELNSTMFPGGKEEKATYYTLEEKKSTSDRYHLGELNYDLMSNKERNAIDAKLDKAGLKPPKEMLAANPEMKEAYQKLIVNYAIKERQILAKSEESAQNQKRIDTMKSTATKEVTEIVTTLQKREKAAFEVKIKFIDPLTGRETSKVVDARDPSLNDQHARLAERALALKEETRILKERDKVEADWKAGNKRILEQQLLDAAADARLTELTRVTDADMYDAMSEEPDPIKREAMLRERKEELRRQHAAEIKEIESVQFEKRVSLIVDNTQLGQGKEGGAYKTVIKTFDELRSIDIDKHLKDLSEKNPQMTEVTKKQIRESLELIKTYKSADEFANQTQSALCNIISGWEAAMLAGRDVNPDFAAFYVEQVKLGAITVDTYGKNKAVFYGTGKDYLGKTTLLAEKHDLYSDAGKAEAIKILQSTDARVAQIYLDYEGDKAGNHFIIAYKDSQGNWKLKDHNVKQGGSKVGEDLIKALERNEIKDIRLVH